MHWLHTEWTSAPGQRQTDTKTAEFVDYVESVCNEFRELYDNIRGTTPYCIKKVAILNCWGKMRAWGNHMVHHAIYHRETYSYAGIIEALSGAPFDVKFISFDDIRNNPRRSDGTGFGSFGHGIPVYE